MTVAAMATLLWRCVAHSAASFPGARRWPPAPGFRHALRASPPSPKKFTSHCQAATPPAARAVLLLLAAPKSLRTAAGAQLQRRAATLARPSTSRRRARAAAGAQLASCAGTSGTLLV